jgi:hypothetical protein
MTPVKNKVFKNHSKSGFRDGLRDAREKEEHPGLQILGPELP